MNAHEQAVNFSTRKSKAKFFDDISAIHYRRATRLLSNSDVKLWRIRSGKDGIIECGDIEKQKAETSKTLCYSKNREYQKAGPFSKYILKIHIHETTHFQY